MSHLEPVPVFIDNTRVEFDHATQTGASIKARARIPSEYALYRDLGPRHPDDEPLCDRIRQAGDLHAVAKDERLELQEGERFRTHAPAAQGITVTINRQAYVFADPHQTGHSLKERAGIPSADVLFLDHPKEDDVITDDTKVVLKCGECFHSAPPANYGAPAIDAADVGFDRFESALQPDGWTYLIVPDYPMPDGFTPNLVRLLIKLPPLFPDAAPDMFWLSPQVRTASGATPQGTSIESVLDAEWQRFSWHLVPGAWRPGISSLRDFMRCVRARLEKRN
jgi:hypothetical protein